MDLSEGIRFILSNDTIRKLCIYLLLTYSLVQPIFTVVLPLFFKTQLEYSDLQYGYLQAFIIFGALLGSIMVGLLFRKEKKLIRSLEVGCLMLMCMMLGFSTLLFPYSISVLGNGSMGYYGILAGVLFLLSIGIMFIHIPVQTFIQSNTPDLYMSRVFSIVGMITKGGIPLGALVYGLILNSFKIHLTIFAATLFTMLFSVIFIPSIKKNHETKVDC